jgi:predicted flap endonuclease-1-like 5' DNA nuclease
MKATDIEGVGPAYAGKLNSTGVKTTDELLARGATPKGREELAERSGLSAHQILEWVNRVDLYRIKGVGSEFSDLLEAAGVDTVVELSRRNAVNLASTFHKLVADRKIVRRIPSERQIADWIEQAKGLPRVVAY